ncbi:MAG: dihydroneopterin aldolase [Puniceicoccales bacterium]|jgi:dihydroneopterin aldolase|nr:dihydroneopterin aldolase [Puniceicoccales bacterium]
MNDRIFIENIEIFAKHGVNSGEKAKPQRFLISICVEFDGTMAKVSDEISHTIDYERLLEVTTNAVQNSSFNLVERLAQHASDAVFAEFPLIALLRMKIEKFPDSLGRNRFSSIGFSSTFSRNGK